ncbi:DnaD domain protein, partial [Opisthorchis viverrini]
MQDELTLLSVLTSTLDTLQSFFVGRRMKWTKEKEIHLISDAEFMTDDKVKPHGPIAEETRGSFTWVYPNSASNATNLLPELEGFCVWSLLKHQGLLVKGDMSLGLLMTPDEKRLYAFSSPEAVRDFMVVSDQLFKALPTVLRRHPELIQFLKLGHIFTTGIPGVQSGFFIEKPNGKVDAGMQTEVHPIESFIDKDYEWNEWELRKKALKLANLRKKATSSVQTILSNWRRDNATQVYLLKNSSTTTKEDGYTQVPRPSVFYHGLRGCGGIDQAVNADAATRGEKDWCTLYRPTNATTGMSTFENGDDELIDRKRERDDQIKSCDASSQSFDTHVRCNRLGPGERKHCFSDEEKVSYEQCPPPLDDEFDVALLRQRSGSVLSHSSAGHSDWSQSGSKPKRTNGRRLTKKRYHSLQGRFGIDLSEDEYKYETSQILGELRAYLFRHQRLDSWAESWKAKHLLVHSDDFFKLLLSKDEVSMYLGFPEQKQKSLMRRRSAQGRALSTGTNLPIQYQIRRDQLIRRVLESVGKQEKQNAANDKEVTVQTKYEYESSFQPDDSSEYDWVRSYQETEREPSSNLEDDRFNSRQLASAQPGVGRLVQHEMKSELIIGSSTAIETVASEVVKTKPIHTGDTEQKPLERQEQTTQETWKDKKVQPKDELPQTPPLARSKGKLVPTAGLKKYVLSPGDGGFNHPDSPIKRMNKDRHVAKEFPKPPFKNMDSGVGTSPKSRTNVPPENRSLNRPKSVQSALTGYQSPQRQNTVETDDVHGVKAMKRHTSKPDSVSSVSKNERSLPLPRPRHLNIPEFGTKGNSEVQGSYVNKTLQTNEESKKTPRRCGLPPRAGVRIFTRSHLTHEVQKPSTTRAANNGELDYQTISNIQPLLRVEDLKSYSLTPSTMSTHCPGRTKRQDDSSDTFKMSVSTEFLHSTSDENLAHKHRPRPGIAPGRTNNKKPLTKENVVVAATAVDEPVPHSTPVLKESEDQLESVALIEQQSSSLDGESMRDIVDETILPVFQDELSNDQIESQGVIQTPEPKPECIQQVTQIPVKLMDHKASDEKIRRYARRHRSRRRTSTSREHRTKIQKPPWNSSTRNEALQFYTMHHIWSESKQLLTTLEREFARPKANNERTFETDSELNMNHDTKYPRGTSAKNKNERHVIKKRLFERIRNSFRKKPLRTNSICTVEENNHHRKVNIIPEELDPRPNPRLLAFWQHVLLHSNDSRLLRLIRELRRVKDRRVFAIEMRTNSRIQLKETKIYSVRGVPCMELRIRSDRTENLQRALTQLESDFPKLFKQIIFSERFCVPQGGHRYPNSKEFLLGGYTPLRHESRLSTICHKVPAVDGATRKSRRT